MKTNEWNRSGCPSPETLSAFYDGEVVQEDLRAHIASCEKCSAAIRDFEAIDKALAASLDSNTPPDIEQRILIRVHDVLKDGSNKGLHLRSGFYFRVAALFAVLGIAGVIIWRDYSAKKSLEIIAAKPRVMESASVPAELSPRRGSIDIRDLDTVNFSNTQDSSNFRALPAGRDLEVQEIPDEVKQTWVIPDHAKDLRQMLSVILHSAGIPADRVTLSRKGNGGYTLEFPATKIQSVRFVKLCKRGGFSLLTPGQPQPEQNKFAGNADDPITYTADFFPKK